MSVEPLKVAIVEPPEVSTLAGFHQIYGIHADEQFPIRYDPQLADWIEELVDTTESVANQKQIPIHLRRFELTPRNPTSNNRVRHDFFQADVLVTARASQSMLGLMGAAIRKTLRLRCLISYDTINECESDFEIFSSYQLPVLDQASEENKIIVRPHMYPVLREDRAGLRRALEHCLDRNNAPQRKVDPTEFFKLRIIEAA